MLQQAIDFGEESDVLYALLAGIGVGDFERATLVKGWTVNDVLVHLHFWNKAADLSLTDEPAFVKLIDELMGSLNAGSLRAFENAHVTERGPQLLAAWRETYPKIVARWKGLDPKTRVKWAGPEMSVRSSMTARQMETWSHGQELFDLFGKERVETDRIRNIVVLGVNTFGWSHKVQRLELPEKMPLVKLTAPSGDVWEYGEADSGNLVEGSAVEFCQVVTQTRNVADTDLRCSGDVAKQWMATAQCFAGPRETPPAPGARVKAG